jgi:hypothetical protein
LPERFAGVRIASADLALAACWAVYLDVGVEHAGVVTGFMNTFGNLGGLVGPIIVGLAVDRWHSWLMLFMSPLARHRRDRVVGYRSAATGPSPKRDERQRIDTCTVEPDGPPGAVR